MPKFLCSLSDECLLSLIREGDKEAQTVLITRYTLHPLGFAKRVAPGFYYRLDEGELRHAAFMAYLAAESKFRSESGSFKNYFMTIYSHEISKIFKEVVLNSPAHGVSLDEDIPGNDGTIVLHDIVTDESEPDPRCYLNYLEECESLNKLPKRLDPLILRVAEQHDEGRTFAEIAINLSLTPKQARKKYLDYVSFVKDGIRIGSFAEAVQKHKEVTSDYQSGRRRKAKKQ